MSVEQNLKIYAGKIGQMVGGLKEDIQNAETDATKDFCYDVVDILEGLVKPLLDGASKGLNYEEVQASLSDNVGGETKELIEGNTPQEINNGAQATVGDTQEGDDKGEDGKKPEDNKGQPQENGKDNNEKKGKDNNAKV